MHGKPYRKLVLAPWPSFSSSWLPEPAHLPAGLRQREEELLARLRRTQAWITDHPSLDEMAELLYLSTVLDALWTEMQPLAPKYVAQRRGELATVESVRACLQPVLARERVAVTADG